VRSSISSTAALVLAGCVLSHPAGRAQAPARTPDGHPDLQGVWQVANGARYDLEDHPARLGVPAGRSVVVDPPDGRIPYQAWARVKRKENFDNSRTADPLKSADPLAKCYMPGVPRATYLGWPLQIFQTRDYVTIAYEWTHVYRIVHVNGTPHPEPPEFWMGDSRGRWEGNTLVVDVRNFNGRAWFDMAGNFHSEALHVVERYTPLDANTLRYEATIEDPKVFTRPWTIRMALHRQPDAVLAEYECHALLEESGVSLDWPRFDPETGMPK
jgi:hypothetical protein